MLHSSSLGAYSKSGSGLGDQNPLMTDCIVILDGGLLSVMVKERTKSLSKEPYPHPVRSGLGSQVEPLEQPQLQQAKCLTGTEI